MSTHFWRTVITVTIELSVRATIDFRDPLIAVFLSQSLNLQARDAHTSTPSARHAARNNALFKSIYKAPDIGSLTATAAAAATAAGKIVVARRVGKSSREIDFVWACFGFVYTNESASRRRA